MDFGQAVLLRNETGAEYHYFRQSGTWAFGERAQERTTTMMGFKNDVFFFFFKVFFRHKFKELKMSSDLFVNKRNLKFDCVDMLLC